MDQNTNQRPGYEPFQPIPKMTPQPAQQLNRPAFWDRLLLLAGSFVVIVGALGAASPYMRERFALLWPDASGEPWFVAAVSISVMALIVYVTLKRWDVKLVEHRQRVLEYEMEERTRRHWNQLYGLIDVSRMVGHRTDIQAIFDGITGTCVDSFDADSVSLMLFEKDRQELEVKSSSGPLSNPEILGQRVSIEEGFAGWAARRREPVLLGSNADANRYPGIEMRDRTIAASMVVPIVVRGELVGVINVSTRNEEIRYTQEDLRTLEVFAENAGSCIRHVEQVMWLRTMVEQLREGNARRDVGEHEPVT